MEHEEGLQVGLFALVEAAQVKGEDARDEQEDHDEDVGHRGGEVALQLALEDCEGVAHDAIS